MNINLDDYGLFYYEPEVSEINYGNMSKVMEYKVLDGKFKLALYVRVFKRKRLGSEVLGYDERKLNKVLLCNKII